jgi:hypothetical protein
MPANLMTPHGMLAATECANTHFTIFCQKYKDEENYVYYFHEGYEDPCYYDTIITTLLNKVTISIRCDNKEGVIALYNFMKENLEYDEKKYMYFIDKDYSDNENIDSNIYVTPYYSVENFYVSTKALRNILRVNFLMEEEIDIKKVIEIYTALQNEFNNKLLTFNSWLACQNDLRETGQSSRLRIDKKVKKYFYPNKDLTDDDIIDKSVISLYRKFEDLNSTQIIEDTIFCEAEKIDISKIEEKKACFLEKSDLYYFFRGKFEFQFLISFLKRLKQYCESNNTGILSKTYTRCSIDLTTKCDELELRKEYLISTLSSSAEKPDCLKSYISSKG